MNIFFSKDMQTRHRNTQKYSNLVILCDEFDLLQQAETSNEIVL